MNNDDVLNKNISFVLFIFFIVLNQLRPSVDTKATVKKSHHMSDCYSGYPVRKD